MNQRSMPGRYPISGSQMKQLTVLRSEFDSMEESLRDALRHESRPRYAKSPIDNNSSLCENTITKHHNYITVYEHEPVRDSEDFRNQPSFNKSHRHVTQPRSPPVQAASFASNSEQTRKAPVDEFQRYCALLVDRIQKMEEKNVELVKRAEEQQHEYQKVVAQVVESEKSQQLLLSECNSLREQVQQLANHNKKLKEQHLLKIKRHMSTEDSNYEGLPQNETPSSSCTDSHQETLQQLHGHTVSLLEHCNTADVTSIVELYAALQKATLADFEDVDDEVKSRSPRSPAISKLSHDENEILKKPNGNRKITYEDPDYASPSSICTAPSCTRCLVRSNSDSLALPNQPQHHHHYHHSHQENLVEKSESVDDRRATLTSQGTCHSFQSFDNNSYIEVELKPGKKFQASQREFPLNDETKTSQSFDRNWKQRPPRHDYENAFVRSDSNRSPVSADSASPFSNSYESYRGPRAGFSPINPTTRSQNRNWSRSPSSTPGMNNPQRGVARSSSFKMKKYSRSASTSELPPPPPPPPTLANKEERNQAARSLSPSGDHRASSRDNAALLRGLKSIRESNAEKHGENESKKNGEFPKTLGMWKNRERTQEDVQDLQEGTAGARRGSYSRACRKSQSLDHLYEASISEEGDEKVHNFNLQQFSSSKHLTNPSQAPFKSGQVKTSDRRIPSPTFVIQESSSTHSPYEMMMPVERMKQKADSDSMNNEKHKKTGLVSPLATSAPKSRLQRKGFAPPPPPTQSTTSEELDSVFSQDFSSNADDSVFTSTQDQRQNRRFSEGVAGNQQKNKLFGDGELKELCRNQSVGAHNSSNKLKTNFNSRPQLSQASQLVTNKFYMVSGSQSSSSVKSVQQPKFPITNPRMKSSISSSTEILVKNGNQPDKMKPKLSVAPKATRQNVARQNTAAQLKYVQSTSPNKKEATVQDSDQSASRNFTSYQVNRELGDSKNAKKQKEVSVPVNASAKKKSSSGGGQSKSFVNLMKAKFTKSPARGHATEKQESKALSAFPVTPASSLIDPRTLSLEPNAFPPLAKNEKKASKQTLGENSDAAVGRKLSQLFPNGSGEIIRPHTQLAKVSEEALHGYDMKNCNSPVLQEANSSRSNSKQPIRKTPSNHPKAMAPTVSSRLQSENKSSWVKQNTPRKDSKSYENVLQSRHKHATENDSPLSCSSTQNVTSPLDLKKKNLRSSVAANEHSYVNVSLASSPIKKIEKTDISSNSNIEARPSFEVIPAPTVSAHENFKPNLKQSTVYVALQNKSKRTTSPSMQARPNDDEAAFIQSHVEAGLKVRQPLVSDRINSISNKEASKQISQALPLSSSSSNIESETTGSYGTLSSIGSLPSDAIESADISRDLTRFDEENSKNNQNHNKTEESVGDSNEEYFFHNRTNDANLHSKNKLPPSKVRIPLVGKINSSQANGFPKESETKDNDFDSSEKNILKVMKSPTKKSHIIYRPSKIATTSKMVQPAKDLRVDDKRPQQGRSSPLGRSVFGSKLKFSPPAPDSLTGFQSRTQSSGKIPPRTSHENSSFFEKRNNFRQRINI